MDHLALIKDIKKGEFLPIYFLQGEETFFIDQVTKALESKVLTEEEKGFNQHIFYGKDAQFDLKQVISAAKGFPMMGERQLVIVKEGQHQRDFEPLLNYLEQPQPSTVFVVNYKGKKYDGKRKLAKALKAKGYIFEFPKLRDYQLPDWIAQWAKSKGQNIGNKECLLLAEHLGNDLARINNEMDKLLGILPKGAVISAADIEQHVGISKEYNAFELQDALIKRDAEKAFQIVHYFIANPKAGPLPMVIGNLYNFFSKLCQFQMIKNKADAAKQLKVHPYFIKQYEAAARQYPLRRAVHVISYLREADVKSKGVGVLGGSSPELYKDLVYKILKV